MNKHFASLYLLLGLLLSATLGPGCDKGAASAPEPLAIEELPSAMEQAFRSAKPEMKELSDQLVVLFKAKDYSKAFFIMQTLAAKSGLTEDQINTTARATLTLNSLLQAAQAAGDQKAAGTLQQYQMNK